MARKGIEKLGRAKERRNLRGYVGTELFGRTAQLIYQCRPTVDDGDDVLEVMAHKKITVSAAFERFELRGDKNWGRDRMSFIEWPLGSVIGLAVVTARGYQRL